jgi:hypothetical protein
MVLPMGLSLGPSLYRQQSFLPPFRAHVLHTETSPKPKVTAPHDIEAGEIADRLPTTRARPTGVRTSDVAVAAWPADVGLPDRAGALAASHGIRPLRLYWLDMCSERKSVQSNNCERSKYGSVRQGFQVVRGLPGPRDDMTETQGFPAILREPQLAHRPAPHLHAARGWQAQRQNPNVVEY